jgi:hypothetical protein
VKGWLLRVNDHLAMSELSNGVMVMVNLFLFMGFVSVRVFCTRNTLNYGCYIIYGSVLVAKCAYFSSSYVRFYVKVLWRSLCVM